MANPRRGLRELKGLLVGSLLVLHKVRTADDQKQNWRCRCVCGKEITVRHDYLIHTNSPKTHCGCLNKGPSVLYYDEYHIWNSMLQRCYSPKHPSYPSYGGRGISVCDSWRADFMNFRKDMGPRPSKLYSLDRIDPNGNYQPGNVQWATDKHQARNKRKSLFLPHPTIPDKMIPAAELAEIMGVTYQTMRYKLMKEGKWPTITTSVVTQTKEV